MKVMQHNQLTMRSQDDHPGNGATWKTYWYLLLAICLLSRSYQLWWVKVHDTDHRNNLHSWHYDFCVHGSTGKWLGELTTPHRVSHLVHLIIIVFFGGSELFMSIYVEHKCFHISCTYGETYLHTTSSNTFVSVFQSCSIQVPDYSARPLARANKSICSHISGHYFSYAKCTTRGTAPNSATIKISPNYYPSKMSWKRIVMPQLFTSQ